MTAQTLPAFPAFDSFTCEGDSRQIEHDGFTLTATIYRDDCGDAPDERQEGFWPSADPSAAGYVQPEHFAAEQARAEMLMKSWKNDEWFYCGVAVTVTRNGIQLTSQYGNALWGVECNQPGGDNSYLATVAAQLAPEALAEARATLAALCPPTTDGSDPVEILRDLNEWNAQQGRYEAPAWQRAKAYIDTHPASPKAAQAAPQPPDTRHPLQRSADWIAAHFRERANDTKEPAHEQDATEAEAVRQGIAGLLRIRAEAKAHDDKLDDAANDGENAQAPTGDDYNELWSIIIANTPEL